MPSWLPASLPSPPEHTWYLGVVPVRAYAVALLAGIVVAVWVAMVRWRARGGDPWDVLDAAFWAVPFGIVGGRVYHVLSAPDTYFGSGADPLAALRVWEGGTSFWGALAGGALGAWIGCRTHGLRLSSLADAAAPGLLLGQAVGSLGSWFNQELYGRPTDLPWALEIDREHLVTNPATGVAYPEGTLFHPTFLYEILWYLAAAGVLLFLDRRFKFGHGRVFWAYVVLYTLGRVWIEMMRIDETEILLGLRLNVWTSMVLGLVALAVSAVLARRFPQREESVERGPGPATTGPAPETMRRA
ncbi:prolipoprotein diacylglyceryl transferase [Myceligenerans pegani]|uniref:Phosphatidylglycerol--prolipoprotein diacylglyceryl transferase n=1 Tax=Myceligenerans pegani TaxID=2776917 RepID=A0ABR9MZU2_9MICO|nr:prolipoprotein diacylglyceryl transferase [Myceligenerans sp. TRM 65318]MBE1876904.1 prolipoprotein diacylglyceryl transferase [Myceligenerans sp. TRM 65318]MBE3019175.1 prolipoprotein diacylglyceryl transferase [Myceligenerans sp. TRM 65318]